MKFKSISISLIAGTMLFFSACTDMLDEKPHSIIAPDQFFSTEAQCIQGVNGVYSALNDIFGQEDLWKSIEQGTDLIMYMPTNDFTQEYTFTAAAPGNVTGIWTKCYRAISNANMVINRVSAAPIPDALKSRLLGEAKYLRALYYYMLVNTFGDVPLWTTEASVEEVSKLPRTSVREVRAQIKTDLLDASANLPATWTGSDVGRTTKGAALALLAKVSLFEKDWPNAQQYAQQVVDLGVYSLISFADIFDPNNKFRNNKESVFEIQFLRNAASNTNTKVNYYYTWFMPLKDANNKTHAGVDFGTTVLRGYENYYPSNAFIKMFETGDKRKDVTLATSFGDQPFTRFLKTDRPWFGAKFWDLQANDRNSGKNLYFQRYSDVLLILAEAMNEQGKPGEALQLINKVRLEHGGLSDALEGLGQDAVRQQIMKERAIEFVGEFQRKWDLARWGTLVDAVKSVADDNPIGARNVKPTHAIFPVPDAEIIKNPNLLPQNDGY
ncbi:RagB/SusD family nutrient uptake outer membrane protein [Chitinophaga sp. S165]|uniref:RagB/SusD family nutrient uptake outer membrane protein n=1 Tax=Chitinophaga sp. S165 TaxID=2135462 RepID=UPI000D70D093|nr:RagB/SusD family nutrient uptake outer membrane protein [Chitinophaga sp. S165]PWV46540.1 putative outer membrane starch-binding protein [Chitinophaga sp. S165]